MHGRDLEEVHNNEREEQRETVVEFGVAKGLLLDGLELDLRRKMENGEGQMRNQERGKAEL